MPVLPRQAERNGNVNSIHPADGTTVYVEVTEETAVFLQKNEREMQNADRRERYHCPYHLEALD